MTIPSSLPPCLTPSCLFDCLSRTVLVPLPGTSVSLLSRVAPTSLSLGSLTTLHRRACVGSASVMAASGQAPHRLLKVVHCGCFSLGCPQTHPPPPPGAPSSRVHPSPLPLPPLTPSLPPRRLPSPLRVPHEHRPPPSAQTLHVGATRTQAPHLQLRPCGCHTNTGPTFSSDRCPKPSPWTQQTSLGRPGAADPDPTVSGARPSSSLRARSRPRDTPPSPLGTLCLVCVAPAREAPPSLPRRSLHLCFGHLSYSQPLARCSVTLWPGASHSADPLPAPHPVWL